MKSFHIKEGVLNKKGLLLERRTFKNIQAFKKVFDNLLSETNIEIKKEVIQKTVEENEKYVIVTYDLGSVDKKVLRIFFQIVDEKTQEIEVDFIELSNQPSRKANTYFIYELTSASVTSNTELKNMIKAIAHICSYYNKKSDLKNITSSSTVFKKYKIDVQVRKRNNFDIAKFRGGNKIIIDYNSDIPLGDTVNVEDSSDPIVVKKTKKSKKGDDLTPKEIQKIDKEIPIQGKIEIDKKTVKRGRKKKEKPEDKAEQPVVQQASVTNVVDGVPSFNLELKKSNNKNFYVSNINKDNLPIDFYKLYGKPTFYEHGDPNKPINIPSKEEANSKINSLNRSSIVTPNLISSNTPMLQNPNFLCTDEQLAVRNTKESVIVNAYAGAGKTTTIIEYCLANPNERKLYMVFSSSLKDEMKMKVAKMGIKNLDVSGTVAMMRTYYVYKTGNRMPDIISEDKDLNLKSNFQTYNGIYVEPDDYDYINEQIESEMRGKIYTFMKRLHVLFCRSSELDIMSYNAEYDLQDEIEIEFFQKNKDKILDFQNRLFQAIRQSKKITWSFLSKFAAINVKNDKDFFSKKYDCVLLDEAQDTSQSIYTFINNQTNVKKIIVGDSHQNIFGFLNTENVLEKFNFKKLNLSSSRRYTQQVANYSMRILDEKIRVGKDTSDVMIYADRKFTGEINSHAYLGRGNLVLIKELFTVMLSDSPLDVMFFEGADDIKQKDKTEKKEAWKPYKPYNEEENTKSGFERMFLKLYDNVITADALYVFYNSYLKPKGEVVSKNKLAWSKDYDWTEFNNKYFYNNEDFKLLDSNVVTAIEKKLLWVKSPSSLMKYAKNNDLQGLLRLLKIFNDKDLQLSNQLFIDTVKRCKEIEPKNKQLFMDSMKNNKDLKHGLFSTIHKSKGLEYDAVTFCRDIKLPKPPFEFKTNSGGNILFDEVTKKPIVQDPVRFNKERQNYIEEINMIYVAATRAKEQIFGKLSLSGESDESEEENELQDLENEETFEEQLMYYDKRYV